MATEEPSTDELPTQMRAWAVAGHPGGPGRLELGTRPVPTPQEDEVLVAVAACGVCRTDLHLADGDLPPRAEARIP
jgi:alcohol dehydrogenase, propanol-preferring